MKSLPILSVVLVALVATVNAGAAGPINIGAVPASLGADQQTLLQSLREKYEVKEMRTNTYLVFQGDPSENTIGVVQFQAGKLVWASRDVGAYGGEVVRNFAQTLVQLLEEISPEDRTPILISATPGTPLGFGSVILEFPGRTVAIDVSYVKQVVDASIEEIIYIDEYADMFAVPTTGMRGNSDLAAGSPGREADLPMPPARNAD